MTQSEKKEETKKNSQKTKANRDWRREVLPKVKAGSTIRVHQKIKEKTSKGEEKERIQIFEGIVLARKGGSGQSATITVRKIGAGGIGVERIFPIHLPTIVELELIKQAKTRRGKLYFLRNYGKRLKEKKLAA